MSLWLDFIGYFREFKNREEWYYCSILAIFTGLTPESIFLLDFDISTNLRSERNELIARYLAIFTNFIPKKSELIVPFLAIFTNIRPERNEQIVRVLLFHGFNRAERNERFSQFLVIFTDIFTHQKTMNLLLASWLFSRILD